jgi:predicted alpha/beta-fold hydrolase
LADQGFSLDDQLSGQRAKVFLNPEGTPVVAFRGTKNKHDMVTDALIMAGLGKYTKRVKHSKKVMKEVEAKYNKPATAIGHSLGGYLAENSGNHGKVITYNKAATGQNKHNKNQIDIRTDKDLISMLTRPKRNNITLKSKSWNPFTSHSTKSLKDKNVIKGKFI